MENTVRERVFQPLDLLGNIRAFILEEDGAEERLPPKRWRTWMLRSRRSS